MVFHETSDFVPDGGGDDAVPPGLAMPLRSWVWHLKSFVVSYTAYTSVPIFESPGKTHPNDR